MGSSLSDGIAFFFLVMTPFNSQLLAHCISAFKACTNVAKLGAFHLATPICTIVANRHEPLQCVESSGMVNVHLHSCQAKDKQFAQLPYPPEEVGHAHVSAYILY